MIDKDKQLNTCTHGTKTSLTGLTSLRLTGTLHHNQSTSMYKTNLNHIRLQKHESTSKKYSIGNNYQKTGFIR